MVIQPTTERRYALPKPDTDPRPSVAGHRNKDDLHEWSIYRQNLTSSIADGMLQPPGVIPSPGSEEYGSRGHLPYGDFQMHEQAVESVLNAGRREDPQLGAVGGDTYLRFGLPRVAVPTAGQFTLQKPSDAFLTAAAARRRAQSEQDLRQSPAAGGGSGQQLRGSGYSIEGGLDQLRSVSNSPRGGHYAESEITMRRRDVDHTDRSGGPTYSGAFLKSSRHHAHYFSNVDLFQQSNGAYNYLRYAKAEEMAPEETQKPHLRVKQMIFEEDQRSTFDSAMLRSPKYVRTLDKITFELYGGDTLALMYTTEMEARTLLRVLANQNVPRGRADGEFEINGNSLRPKAFAERVSYVSNDDLYPRLTVKQHLHLMSSFVKPATDAFKTKHMIGQLIQTLALTPFRNRLICELGRTEKQRVKVACQILLDTDILVIDNITKGMDLYDAAFVIDYLRDWATKLNRIVIMAIAPSTYEIVTMFYKTAILASGRLIYFGKSNRMIDYFESLDFPCPMFKNPCDYYVDLVTHDYLTADASMESQERIRRLADMWQQKAPRLADVPVDLAPPRVRRANLCVSLFCLYKRFWLLFFNHPWEYAREVFYALLLSVLLGIIYFELASDRRAGINDRFGLFYALLVIFLLPNLLVNIERICSERLFVYPETKIRLYGKLSFLFVKVIFDFPLAIITYIIYASPAYLLAGLQTIERGQWQIFAIYVAVIVLHGLLWRYISWMLAYAFRRRMVATGILALIMGASALTCGVTLHRQNESTAVKWFDYVSPGHWAMQVVASDEFYGNNPNRSADAQLFPIDRSVAAIGNTTELVIDCERKRVLATKIADVPIYTVSQCSRIAGRQAYHFVALGTSKIPFNNVPLLYTFSFSLLGAWALIALASTFCCIFCNHKPFIRQRHRE